jgi:hypothetical protein
MTTQTGPEYDVPNGEWVEVISYADAQAALGDAPDAVDRENGRFDLSVADNSVYLSHSDSISTKLARGPYPPGVSGPIDPVGQPVYARAESGVATVSADREGFIFDENSVTVETSISRGYENGASFDSASYPITFDPQETIREILLSSVPTAVDVEITTISGDVITLPVDTKSSIDSFETDSFEIKNPTDGTKATAGAWAGE